MIGALNGSVFLKKNEYIIVMVGGVGYQVSVSPRISAQLQLHSEILLYTYTHVREDALHLFGFITLEELHLFEQLLHVSGIGPKTALLILNYPVDQIQSAILSANVGFFTNIPRLGTKNAQKIIIELKSKLGSVMNDDIPYENTDDLNMLIEALSGFGFMKKEIILIYKKIPPKTVTFEDKIKCALKLLGKNV